MSLAAKHELRHRLLDTLRALPAAQRDAYSADLRRQLTPFLPPPGNIVALYAPLPHEVDLMPLMVEHPGLRFAFPRCLPGGKLQFHLVADPQRELIPGAHGIPAPAPTCPSVDATDIRLLVVPGVAFTRDRRRLGYGGGYYDRFIPLCTQARLVALAFPRQIVPDIPTESHDIPLPQLLIAME